MLAIDNMPEWLRRYSRSIMVLAISLTIGFIALVLLTQISLIEKAHSSSRSSYYLSHDIADLRTQWSHVHASEVREQVKQAEQMLLQDFDHLTVWLQQMESQASLMGLKSKYRVRSNRTRVEELKDVDVIPVDIEILPEQSLALSGAYEQYVHFLRYLTDDQVRVDLLNVQVQGGDGAAQMSILIHVWVKVAA